MVRTYYLGILLLASLILDGNVAFAASDPDRIILGIEGIGHLAGQTPLVEPSTKTLKLPDISSPFGEMTLFYGIRNSPLGLDISFKTGWRISTVSLQAASVVHNQSTRTIAYTGIPIAVGTQLQFFSYWIKPFLSLDAGGCLGKLEYQFTDNTAVESEWGFTWEAQLSGGVQAQAFQWLDIRLFARGLASEGLQPDFPPALDSSGLYFGTTLVFSFPIPNRSPKPPTSLETDEKGEPLLKDYSAISNATNSTYEWIRKGDLARRERRYIESESCYRKAIALMPHRLDVQVNLEVPVRVDWARVLREIGRSAEAIAVIKRALDIDPYNILARELYLELVPPSDTP